MRQIIHQRIIKTLLFLILIFLAGNVWAHFNWIAPFKLEIKKGETAYFSLNHGHNFPEGEETPNLDYVKAFMLSPSGKKMELIPEKQEGTLVVSFSVEETGSFFVYFEEDRGVRSRTPRGWQRGGKDKYPDADLSMKYYSSSLTYLQIGDNKKEDIISLGLPFELAGTIKNNILTAAVFKQKQPLADVEISLVKENTEPEAIGRTDKSGEIRYDLHDFKGKLLLIASYSKKMSAEANYKEERASSTLYFWVD